MNELAMFKGSCGPDCLLMKPLLDSHSDSRRWLRSAISENDLASSAVSGSCTSVPCWLAMTQSFLIPQSKCRLLRSHSIAGNHMNERMGLQTLSLSSRL